MLLWLRRLLPKVVAALLFHWMYAAIQMGADVVGAADLRQHWAVADVWTGVAMALALLCALAVTRASARALKVNDHEPGCRWLTGAIVFCSMWRQEDVTVAGCAFIALQAAPALWWFGKRAHAVQCASASEGGAGQQARPRLAADTGYASLLGGTSRKGVTVAMLRQHGNDTERAVTHTLEEELGMPPPVKLSVQYPARVASLFAVIAKRLCQQTGKHLAICFM